MKRILLTTILLLAFSVMGFSSVQAQSSSGNPVGYLESLSCSTASGWSYDPDLAAPPAVYGCTNSSATNYNPNATNDDGSCVLPPQACVSRYRWVNTSGGVNQAQGCANAGATAVASSFRGICASGEDRPSSGYDVNSIDYRRGTWGGGNGGGGTIVRSSSDDYRCYQSGQQMDEDATDIAVAYYCDFGSSYPESCPADNPAPPSGGGGGGGGGCFTPETTITMADGSSKTVSSLAEGDVVRGETSDNVVLEVKHVLLGDRFLYSINGSEAFVTSGHPFKTTEGWKSIDPAETAREGVNLPVTQLSLGDELITETGLEEVKSISPKAGDSSMVLYNPMLDGDHTYYANGLLVHNKQDNIQLNFSPKSFFKSLASLFKPLMAIAASSDSNSVLVYEGGIDSGTLIATIPANQYRPDVNAVMGISGNHGFSWSVPSSLSDGASHTLYFYGTNTDGAGRTSELGNSPATIQCSPSAPSNSAPSSPSISCPSSGSYTNTSLQVSFTASDPNGNEIRYLVDWDNNGTTDQIVPTTGSCSGGQQVSSCQPVNNCAALPGASACGVYSNECSWNGNSCQDRPEFSCSAYSSSSSCNPTYRCDWIAGQSCSGSGTVPSGTEQSAYRSWSTPGQKTVRVSAADDQGATSSSASCSFTIVAPPENPTASSCSDGIDNDGDGQTDFPADLGCTDPSDTDETGGAVPPVDICISNPSDPSCNPGGGGGGPGSSGFCLANPADPSCIPGSTFCSANPGAPSCAAGFTVNSSESSTAPIQFLGSLAATSTPRRLEVNPVSGFTDPVLLHVVGIQSRSGGNPLPAGVIASYTFDDAGSTATLTWNESIGRYMTSYGIGSLFKVALSQAISEAYNVTIRGTSVNNPAVSSEYVLTIDPSSVNPQFREI